MERFLLGEMTTGVASSLDLITHIQGQERGVTAKRVVNPITNSSCDLGLAAMSGDGAVEGCDSNLGKAKQGVLIWDVALGGRGVALEAEHSQARHWAQASWVMMACCSLVFCAECGRSGCGHVKQP